MSIELTDVWKSFGPKEVLRGLTLTVPDGKTVALVGASGSGKSVMLKHIVGLLHPDRGSVKVDDLEVPDLSREELYDLRRRVGFVFQFAALFDSMTIGENIAMGLKKMGTLAREEIRQRIEESLSVVDLDGFADRMPADLSGGQRKRAGLARAIAFRPGYLLYDEPTSGLDPVTTTVIDRLIQKIRKELGVTSLVITHDMTSADRVSDSIALLYEGRIIEEGTPEEIRQSENRIVRGFVEGKPELMEAGREGEEGE